jgi:MFS family permease
MLMDKPVQDELRDFAGIPESSRRYFGWRVVAALFVIAVLAWGFGFYGHAVYLAELQRLHGWPTSLIASASTMYYLASAILVIFVNDVIRRLGARRCILFGALCFAISIAALSQVTKPWQLFGAYFVMALAWATMTLGAITNILGLWFDRRRGLAISLALNGASFGGVVVIPAMVFAIGAAGFATTMLAASAVILLLAIPLGIFVLGRTPPQRLAATPAPGAAPAISWTRAGALKSPAFWTIAAPFSIGLFSQAAFLVHQIAFLETSIGRAGAGIAVAITTVMAIAGRLVMGSLVDRLNLRKFTALSFGTQALALAAMTQTTSLWPLFLFCAVYGFSVGNLITLPSLIVQREFAPGAFGMIVALSTAICQFTYAFGPGLIGAVRDASASYTPALLLCFALNAIAAAVILFRPKA